MLVVMEVLGYQRTPMNKHESDSQPVEPDDQELVIQAQGGDPGAFDQLAVRYQKQLFSVIYNILLNIEDTEDVLMETLLKAYKNISRFRTDAKFYTWIYQIAYNESINSLRKRKRLPQKDELTEMWGEDSTQDQSSFKDNTLSSDPERQVNLKELEIKLNESLATLSEDHRTVVNLFDIQGLSHSEIGFIMKCSEGTVRSRLHYAHKELQKLLRNYI